MLKIYDDRELRQRLRLRHLTVLTIFVTGLIVGRHWAGSDDGLALAQTLKPATATLSLKLDEGLRAPLQPAASNRALPPTAEVLTVSVRSETNLER